MIETIMPCRYEVLDRIVAGLHSGVPFVGFDGSSYVPFSNADDLGIYYYIPKLVEFFSLSLDEGILFFFQALMLFSFVSALIGFFLLYRSWTQRIIACVMLADLYRVASLTTDTYLAYMASCLAVIPLFLFFVYKRPYRPYVLPFFFGAGFFLASMHYIRAYSSVAVILFMIIVLTCRAAYTWRKKLLCVAALMCGMAVPYAHFSYLYQQHVNFIKTTMPDKMVPLKNHTLWHSVYIGFGFLNNDHNIVYSDMCAVDRVKDVAPGTLYCSAEYEKVLLCEVLSLLKDHRNFVIKTIFAKLGVLFFYFLRFAHIGILAAIFYRKPWWLECAFAAACAFNALFGLLIMPSMLYCLGFITLAALYGIVSINYALSRIKFFSA